MPVWVLDSEVVVNIVPRDTWIFRPIPSDPSLVRTGIRVEPTESLGASINAAGFVAYVVLADGVLNWGRSRRIPFNALQPDKSIFVLSPAPQTSWSDLGSARFAAISLPPWFPETKVSILTYA